MVNRDLAATLPGQDPLILLEVPAGDEDSPGGTGGERVHVAMPDGRWHGNPVHPSDLDDDPPELDDPATALAVVADAAQETLTELLWRAWPVCGEHGFGMHLRPAGSAGDRYRGAAGPPVWWCRDGGHHDVSPVGELAAALQGGRRS